MGAHYNFWPRSTRQFCLASIQSHIVNNSGHDIKGNFTYDNIVHPSATPRSLIINQNQQLCDSTDKSRDAQILQNRSNSHATSREYTVDHFVHHESSGNKTK